MAHPRAQRYKIDGGTLYGLIQHHSSHGPHAFFHSKNAHRLLAAVMDQARQH